MMIVVISVSGLVGCGSKKTSSVIPGSSILPAPTKSITDAPVNAKTNEITVIQAQLNSLKQQIQRIEKDREFLINKLAKLSPQEMEKEFARLA